MTHIADRVTNILTSHEGVTPTALADGGYWCDGCHHTYPESSIDGHVARLVNSQTRDHYQAPGRTALTAVWIVTGAIAKVIYFLFFRPKAQQKRAVVQSMAASPLSR